VSLSPEEWEQMRAEQRRSQNAPERFRMLPASDIGERGVVCSILLAPMECISLAGEYGITVEHFHNPALGEIFRTLMRMHDDLKKIDNVTLTQFLADAGKLEQVGGAATIAELFTYLPTATNVKYYLEILQEKYTLRQMITVATEFASRAYDEQDNVEGLIGEFQKGALTVGEGKTSVKFTRSKDAVMEAMGIIQDTYERRGSITGLATGFHDFDKLTNGLQAAEMIVIAARPSQGKTAFAMNIAEFIAVELQQPVGIFSMEMPTVQLKTRMLCSRARVNLARVRDGHLSERDFPALTAAASKLAEAPIFYDESSDLTIQEFRARARRMKLEHNVVAIFIDYLQLMRSSSKKSSDNREREVAECSAGIKGAAKELGIPIVVLAQIGRDFEKRGPLAKPRLSDLRESGSIEQDADLVAFMIRPETMAETEELKEQLAGQAELIVAKHRSGPLGDVPLTFLKEFTRFETRATGDEEADAEANQQKLDYGSPL
jgi:replicative DNA helicase